MKVEVCYRYHKVLDVVVVGAASWASWQAQTLPLEAKNKDGLLAEAFRGRSSET